MDDQSTGGFAVCVQNFRVNLIGGGSSGFHTLVDMRELTPIGLKAEVLKSELLFANICFHILMQQNKCSILHLLAYPRFLFACKT